MIKITKAIIIISNEFKNEDSPNPNLTFEKSKYSN